MKVVMCENNLCIYCKDYKCTCDQISIDSIGACSETIHVSIDEDTLNKLKKKLLDQFEKYDKS